MKFKIDENLPNDIADDLRALGFDADTVYDEGLTGAADSQILARIQAECRVLLTMDKGIADVRKYPPDQYPGIILFRPVTSGRNHSLMFVRQHLPALLRMNLAGHLFVVTQTGIRVR